MFFYWPPSDGASCLTATGEVADARVIEDHNMNSTMKPLLGPYDRGRRLKLCFSIVLSFVSGSVFTARLMHASQVKAESNRVFEPKEALSQAVNRWIRTSNSFDAVIDFDAILRDPDHPSRLLPRFASRDHLHPNDDGYQAVADSLDTNMKTWGNR